MTKEELNRVKMWMENAKIENGCIIIPKKELDEWIKHYEKIGGECMEHGCPTYMTWFYWGKREVLVDLLKHFPDNESEEER